jgi:peptidoglycan hydrolase-like protein with peptidoglycan-binding domain
MGEASGTGVAGVTSMKAMGKRRAGVLVLFGLVGLALVGWLVGGQIRSPGQVAADTAPPPASPITVPVVRQTLSTEVVVRGTVRYGAPQGVVLGTSRIKQGSDIVTRPPRQKTELKAGEVVMNVDGRPVFVLPGAIPMHRDLHPGDRGPDVRQLERALVGLGFHPGAVDGVYDSRTEAAVSAFYLRQGWDPFGATDAQLEQLRSAEAAAAAARDAHLQAVNNIEQARRTITPGEVAQARIDSVTARETLDTRLLELASAEARLASARSAAGGSSSVPAQARAEVQRDQALADAEVANKRLAYNQAVDDQRIAGLKADEVPSDAPPSEREAAAASVRQSAENVRKAKAELDAAVAAANATRIAGKATLRKARAEADAAGRDARLAGAEVRRARLAVQTARRGVALAADKVRLLTRPVDTGTLRAIAATAAREERRTRDEVARVSRMAGIQVPANEILFFPTLPLRVDTVQARRGSTVTGTVMKVTNSRLAIDSQLSASDAKLVHSGDSVTIEEQDLGIKVHGTVTQVADTPGTHRVDPTRFYMVVTPTSGLLSLVGASVKLTIAVKSTQGEVLAVPVSALSVGGDGNSRIQVRRHGRTELITVIPGLAAEGLVEVRPAANSRLAPGDLVVVGSNAPDRQLTASVGRGP